LAALGGIAGAVSRVAANGQSDVPVEVNHWWEAAPHPPGALVEEVCQGLESGRDLFGELYTAAVSTSNRRKLGTIFTPPSVTAHVLARCEEHGVIPAAVVDPGAGVGAFTLDAVNKWRVPVVAVDLNVVTLGFLAARCHLAGYETSAPHHRDGATKTDMSSIHLVRADFLSWLPDALSRTPGPALVVGNPPYTRHQGLDSKVKEAARDAAGPLITSGLAGMAAYFLGAILRHLRPSDALCMVLPGSWMHARYGREIRQHLWRLSHRSVGLDVFPHDVEVFPQTKVDAVVLFVGPREDEPRRLTVTEASISGAKVAVIRKEDIDRELEVPEKFPRVLRDWGQTSSHRAELSESFAVHRGIATGRNAFFLLTDAEAAEHQIPSSALTPVVGSLRNVIGDALDDAEFARLGSGGVKRWLLLLRPDDAEVPEIRTYLERGRRDGVTDGVLASRRAHWFAVEDLPAAPLLLLPMTKRAFRVVRNSVGAKHTNSIYGLYPRSEDVDVDEAARWLQSPNGQKALRHAARQYSSGLLKLEPRAVEAVGVPRSFGRGR
jgi:predicted RNA methylase